MIERKHETLTAIYIVADALASCIAMLLAYYFRFGIAIIPVTKGPQSVAIYTHTLPLVAVIFPLAFAIQGMYRVRPMRKRTDEWANAAVGAVVGGMVLSGVLLWIRPGNPDVLYSRATLAIFVAFDIVSVIGVRTLISALLRRRYRAGRNLDRVLIAGSGELARAVVQRVEAHRHLGFELVGYIAEERTDETLDDLRCLGTFDEAGEIVEAELVDHVFVAVPLDASASMMKLLETMARHFVSIHVIPDLLQFMALRSRVEDLDGLPMINLTETPLDGWSRVIKRAFDIAVAAAAMVVASPLMLAVAIAIWIEDHGPVFYRQLRMGLDGVPFNIVKFRSMKVNAEAATGPVWAHRDDRRTTRVGRFIRTWSLDELPQLWNVLRGDMSIVGPRPERPQFVEQFRTEYPHYMLRHKVRAGITGWAQVHGWRGNTSMKMRIEHDLYYIENWSLLLDLKILLMTVRSGIRNENAY